jgi:hypothetical protein
MPQENTNSGTNQQQELTQKIAKRVWELFKQDLRLEQQRTGREGRIKRR